MSLARKLRQKAFRCGTVDAMLAKATGQTKLKRVLGLVDLVLFGVGSIIGSGVFVLTGEVARETAGPGVIVSYAVAGFAALFAALSYAEFAADVPVSGAAYNYVDLVFGEFTSWLVASSLLMEYILSSSMVAKGVSGYLSTLIGIDSDAMVMTLNGDNDLVIDVVGFGITVFLTALLAYGARESFTFNGFATLLSVIVILFTIGAAIPNVETKNYSPFFPEELGTASAFHGASILFFSYIGFDALSTVAEESKNPSRDLPIGIVSSVVICSALYIFMAAALVGMIPYTEIDVMAAYSTGFTDVGWDWAGRIVSFGALCGIATSLFSSLCGQARLIMVLGREGFLPRFLGEVNQHSATPINATITGGAICAVITLLLDISTLASLVSVGTMFAFCLVCMAAICRRYVRTAGAPHNGTRPASRVWIGLRLVLLTVISAIEGIAVDREWPLWVWLCTIVCFLTVVASFYRLPEVFTPSTFALRFQPLESCLGVLFCVHLGITLGTPAYTRFIILQIAAVIVYLMYGVHHTGEAMDQHVPLVQTPNS